MGTLTWLPSGSGMRRPWGGRDGDGAMLLGALWDRSGAGEALRAAARGRGLGDRTLAVALPLLGRGGPPPSPSSTATAPAAAVAAGEGDWDRGAVGAPPGATAAAPPLAASASASPSVSDDGLRSDDDLSAAASRWSLPFSPSSELVSLCCLGLRSSLPLSLGEACRQGLASKCSHQPLALPAEHPVMAGAICRSCCWEARSMRCQRNEGTSFTSVNLACTGSIGYLKAIKSSRKGRLPQQSDQELLRM